MVVIGGLETMAGLAAADWEEAASAAKATLGIRPRGGGGGPNGPGGPGGLAPIIIMALAFSAAAAAAMRLLFSASLKRGDRNRNDGSIPGGIAYASLEKTLFEIRGVHECCKCFCLFAHLSKSLSLDESLKPLAKGLLSIFNLVICN